MSVVARERRDLLRDRLRSWSGKVIASDRAEEIRQRLPAEGKRFRFFLRTVLALISAISGTLLWGLLHVLHLPAPEIAGAAAAIGASVWARRSLGWRHTGAEEGWMLSGLWILVFALPDGMLGSESIWYWLAGASFLAGAVVRAPLFLGLSAALALAGVNGTSSDFALMWVALAGTAVATLARFRRYDSPFVEISLCWVQIAAALVAASQLLDRSLILSLVTAMLVIALGIVGRDTVTLWSALAFLAVAIYEGGRHLPMSDEWKLIAGGTTILVLAIAMERWLRSPRRGWTARAVAADESELLELVGAVAAAPTRGAAPRDDGGEFGGGGATERF